MNKTCINTAIAAAIMAAITLPVAAELPGLPTTRPAEATTAAAPAAPAVVHSAGAPQATPFRGSLFKMGAVASSGAAPTADGQPHAAPTISYIEVAVPEAKHYKKNDVITVIVREDSDSLTNGKGSAQKSQDFDLALEEFLQLAISSSGIPMVSSVNNPSNLPEIKFKYNNNRSNDAEQQRQDSFSARISAMVVDVKPNGTMVIEATKHITIDKEEHTIKLSGVCRVEDIAVDNTILSTQLADLSVSKQTKGEVHDVNNRGWLNKWMDKWMPF